jgi:hypothetical protein
LGVALIWAAFRVDMPDADWWESRHLARLGARTAFLLIIATGALAPLAMAAAVRGDPGWRPIAVVSVAATVLFVVFLFLRWGNATFLLAIITLFAWIAAIAIRLATLRRADDQRARRRSGRSHGGHGCQRLVRVWAQADLRTRDRSRDGAPVRPALTLTLQVARRVSGPATASSWGDGVYACSQGRG